MRESEASWQVSARLRAIRSLLLAKVVEEKLRALERAVKANFDPNQPRVPRGNPDGGQWTSTGGPHTSQGPRASATQLPRNELLASAAGDPSNGRPEVPKERPLRSRARTRIYKEVATWLARETVGKRIGLLLMVLDQAGWLEPAAHAILTYSDPPKTLEELQSDVSNPTPGYDIHHIVEQTSAEQDGFPRSMIDAPDNLVRIPTMKHWLITGWYMIPNEEFGWSSPRSFLSGKDWDERVQVGHKTLVKFGLLKE